MPCRRTDNGDYSLSNRDQNPVNIWVLPTDVVACLDGGVVELLDKNSGDDFYVGFLLSHPVRYLLEGTLGENLKPTMFI